MLGILILSIAAVVAPVYASATLFTRDGMSRNALITHVLLPMAHLLIMLLIVMLANRTLAAGSLDLVWFRAGRGGFETRPYVQIAAAPLLLVVALWSAVLATILVNKLGLKPLPDRMFSAEGRGLALFLALTAVIVIVSPVLEEVFWRGYVQRVLERLVGCLPAVLVQAALFAAVHARSLGGLAPVVALGLVAGAWRWRRRTLAPIILAHMVLSGLYCGAHWPHWLDCTRVRVTTNYVARMAQAARGANYDPNADAHYLYQQAFQLTVVMPEQLGAFRGGYPVNWPQEALGEFRKWVAANEKALECLARGTQRSYYCPVYMGDSAMVAGMPQAAAIRNLAFALDARIKLEAFAGDDEQLLRDVASLYRFACHFGGPKVLSHQFVGISIRALATDTTREVVARESLPPETMSALQLLLEQLGDADRNAIDLSVERLVWLDGIQRIFTDEGNGQGHIPRAVITGWYHLPEAARSLIDPMCPPQNQALLKLSRRETTDRIEEFMAQIRIAADKTPWELHSEPNGVRLALDDLIRGNTFVELLGPACLRVIELPWRARAELDALVTTLAVLRCKQDRGEYPDSLAQLVQAGYLKRVPQDPYSGNPLSYKWGDNGFLLYSLGPDFDDDGGTPSNWGEGPDGGDQVFWPVR
ncbi:MAG: hypothetical protein A2Y76_02515 [Planctomycetes bacterium RBG_13_60_9]|nr:MAG: hypothetical protein A2Y76_02515 [Planctomycetes bacterium RBG_13_60_9]